MADITGMLQAAAGAGGAEETDPNFNQTVLLLHGDGTNGAQNNTFLDASTNNFTITRNGNTTQGTFSPFSAPDGRWSNYFDGSGDYLSVADNAAFTLGSSDFTVEFWMYNGTTGARKFITGQIDSAGGNASSSFFMQKTSGNKLLSTLNQSTTAYDATSSNDLPLNAWTHIAYVRDGNTTRQYINGVQDGTADVTGVTANDSSNTLSIGRAGELNLDYFPAYISNYRMVVGTCLYPNGTTFTPSTSPLTTTSQGATSSEVEILTCQSNRFVDNSSNGIAITRNGGVKVTPFSPFAPTAAYDASVNGGSGYFDGSGDYLAAGAASDWTFLSSTTALFSIELWVYNNSTGSSGVFCATNSGSSEQIGFGFAKLADETITFTITRGVSLSRVVEFVSTQTIKTNEWTHILLTYDQSLASGNLKFYVNGGAAETGNKTANAPSNSNPATALRIGSASGSTNFLNGFIGGMRISNVIRSNVVPTGPYTSDANTKLLVNYTNAGIFDNTGKNNLETVGNAQIDTTTKKFGTGSMEFDGTGDVLVAKYSPDYDVSNGDFTIECWAYFNALGNDQIICICPDNTSGYAMAGITILSDGSLRFLCASGSSTWINTSTTSASTITTGVWYHIAAVRSGSNFNLYVDGVDKLSYTSSSALYNFKTAIQIGAIFYSGAYNDAVDGFIDDLRITKGVARYTSAFTPPTKAFPDL